MSIFDQQSDGQKNAQFTVEGRQSLNQQERILTPRELRKEKFRALVMERVESRSVNYADEVKYIVAATLRLFTPEQQKALILQAKLFELQNLGSSYSLKLSNEDLSPEEKGIIEDRLSSVQSQINAIETAISTDTSLSQKAFDDLEHILSKTINEKENLWSLHERLLKKGIVEKFFVSIMAQSEPIPSPSAAERQRQIRADFTQFVLERAVPEHKDYGTEIDLIAEKLLSMFTPEQQRMFILQARQITLREVLVRGELTEDARRQVNDEFRDLSRVLIVQTSIEENTAEILRKEFDLALSEAFAKQGKVWGMGDSSYLDEMPRLLLRQISKKAAAAQ